MAAQKFWVTSTRQGRRWLMEQRLEAVEQNEAARLAELLSYQQDVRPRELTAALEIAVMKRSDVSAPCVELLLRQGADPRAANGSGTPLLLLAADAGCTCVVRLLLGAKGHVDQTREDGATALHRAAWGGHIKVMTELVAAGARLESRDHAGRTPFVVAAQGNRTDSMRWLMERGARVSHHDLSGRGAPYWTVYHTNTDMLRAVISTDDPDIDLSLQGPDGLNPLILAARQGAMDALELLLNQEVELELRSAEGEPALVVAARSGRAEAAAWLVAAGADVNASASGGYPTALVYLVHDEEAVEYLLDAGADPSVHNDQNFNALWIAAMSDYEASVRQLLYANCGCVHLAAGVDVAKWPLQLALYDGRLSTVQMLYHVSEADLVDLSWLRTYLDDENLCEQAERCEEVAACREWLSGRLLEEYPARGSVITLVAHCRRTLRTFLGGVQFVSRVSALPLPTPLRNYITLKQELDC